MVIKILPRSREKRNGLSGPKVCLPKLEVVFCPVESSSSQSIFPVCQKEEIPCFFNSEVDLNDIENNVRVEERSLACQCGYCSPLYDFKNQMREDFLAQQEAQIGYCSPPVNEILHNSDVERTLPPQPVYATNAGTQTETKVYRFTCKDCGSQFNEEYFFDHHRKSHVKMLECAFCTAQFSNEKSLEGHILLHLKEPLFECIYCPAVYCKKRFLNDHLKIHEKYLFSCRSCSAKFESKSCLELHQKTHSSSGSLVHVFRKLRADQVPPNEKDGPFELVVSVPMQKDLPPAKSTKDFFECEKCNLKFNQDVQFRKHNAIHNRKASQYLHFCTTCDARFRLHPHLKLHLKAAHKKS